ncbi:adenylate/guanylate cyclase domain-containing protein [Massilia arenosa]|uniref:Adenylate/guanylate cyclase domain-containing protein n=1 Tax=Zemynaea arenosa TaxID=2561931 RepID=A0A4Y9SLC0_9BURK|nr:adenylate/guanylate cyclase domain-containing protein [Massilia arenosa]TFW22449.1 adenylate/guanylate cyclase domain-containing protein [Massilia arenosa]
MPRFLRLLAAPKGLLCAAALAVALAELCGLHALRPLDNRLLDWMVRSHAATLQPDPDIVIVDIDDASLARMESVAGSWPWPRSVHAELLDRLRKQEPRAIVFDLTFSERDVYRPDSDRLFNEALAGNTNIYFPLARQKAANDKDGAPALQVAPLLGLRAGPHADPDARIALQPPLAVDARYWRTGTINYLEDADGIGRRYPLYIDAHGWQIPSLPARVARDLGFSVPQAPDLTLHWRGGLSAYHHIPYADLYEDFTRERPQRPADELKGKIVIIGSDATTLNDLRATPIASLYPAVQVVATAIDNLKNRRAMAPAPAWVMPTLTVAALLVVFRSFRRRSNTLSIAAMLALLSVGWLAASWVGVQRNVLLPVVAPLVLVWVYMFAGTLQEYLAERRTRQQAVTMFSRFVNPHVVRQLVEHGQVARAGEAREITVLFSDIRGFTTLSETRTPQEVVALLNRYFTLQVEVVFRHGGSLDKFIGDCIMAFWGAPLDDPRHAQNAVAAALEMAEVLQRFKRELNAEDLDFDVGIGLHSGPAVVGLIGSDQRREYTAIGDTVNLASRIEGLTKGVSRILVSDSTRRLCGDEFTFTPHGSFAVKGREQPVELYGPQGRKHENENDSQPAAGGAGERGGSGGGGAHGASDRAESQAVH